AVRADGDGLEPGRHVTERPVACVLAEPALTGYTAAYGLEPDVLAVGKSIGGGIACAGYGFTDDVATRLTEDAFARMIALGERFERGVQSSIDRHDLPWHVTRLGCRVEYLFRADRPRTGSDAAAGGDPLLDRLIHLWALNRGILLTPFHNMALMS